MKAVVAAFNQEKALVGAFSVIVQLCRLIVNSSRFVCVCEEIFQFDNNNIFCYAGGAKQVQIDICAFISKRISKRNFAVQSQFKKIIIRFNNGINWIGTMNNGEMISFSDNWKHNNCYSENLVISTRRITGQSRWVDSELCYLWYYIKLSCSAVSI